VPDPLPTPNRAVTTAGAPDRRATAAFAAAVGAAGIWLLVRAGRGWFLYDEWMWFGARKAVADRGDVLDALLLPHAEHLSLLPAGVYGLLYRLVGLHDYWPYVAVLLALHVTVAVLLRLVMLRSGVGPWLAGGTAFVLVLLGAGAQNIVWAFQIGFVGALAAVLGQMLLVDHAGPVDRRDVLGATLGVAAVATQTVGVLGVGLVAAVLVLRRRWGAAAVASIPAASLYLMWKVSFGGREIALTTDVTQVFDVAVPDPGVGDKARFFGHLMATVGHSLAPFPGGGLLVPALLAVAAAAVVRRRASVAIVPLVLAAGAVAFAALTAWNRAWLGEAGAEGGRYVYTIVVLTLPLLSLGLQQALDTPAARRVPAPLRAGLVAAALLAVVVAGARQLDRELDVQVANGSIMRRQITAAATIEGYERVDPTRPFSPQLSYSFGAAEVLPLRADDALPDAGPDAPADRLDVAARLLVEVRDAADAGDGDLEVVAVTAGDVTAGSPGCELVLPLGGPARIELQGGVAPAAIEIVADGAGTVSARAAEDRRESWPVALDVPAGERVAIRLLAPLALVLEVGAPIELCGLPAAP
jgi:hypothetical protein